MKIEELKTLIDKYGDILLIDLYEIILSEKRQKCSNEHNK